MPELTKLHEEVIRTTFSGAIARYTEQPPKGEFVLVVRGAEPDQSPAYTHDDGVRRAEELMAAGLPRSEAADRPRRKPVCRKRRFMTEHCSNSLHTFNLTGMERCTIIGTS